MGNIGILDGGRKAFYIYSSSLQDIDSAVLLFLQKCAVASLIFVPIEIILLSETAQGYVQFKGSPPPLLDRLPINNKVIIFIIP